MKSRSLFLAFSVPLALCSCVKSPQVALPTAKAFGSAITLVGGDKQIAGVGQVLDQPVAVQVNDEKGAPVAGALVQFESADGAKFTPAFGLTGADGQLTTNPALGGISGHSVLRATTRDKSGKTAELKIDEIALGYQQTLGREVYDKYCTRCHDPESSAERVSNHDNLSKPPHPFTDGATYNAISDANVVATISHGGQALGKSAEMPPLGETLSKSEIMAVVAYIRAVADPPYHPQGVAYASK